MQKWTKVREYIKSHKFNTIVVALLILAGVVELAQFRIMTKNYLITQENRKELESLKTDVDRKQNDLSEKIYNTDISVNSRIDILDNSVKINEKRKMLIKKIRDAITENTTTQLDIRTLNRIAMSVIDYSYTYNISIAGLLAQIRVESNFDANATSGAGAQGLGQIMPETHEHIMLKTKNPMLNPWDVNDNIMMTCSYMAELMAKFGNWEDALRAYNAGPETVKRVKAGITKRYLPETEEYVPKVVKWKETFKRYGLE